MSESNLAPKLHRRILLYSVAGMLAAGTIAALISIIPLLLELREAQEKNLLTDLQARATLVDQYIGRAKAAPALMFAGSRYRAAAEAMDDLVAGRVPRERAKAALQQVVDERVSASTNTAGVAILDLDGQVLAAAGPLGPPSTWPVPNAAARDVVLKGPVLIDGERYLLSGAPFTNRLAQRIGTSIVAYRTRSLQSIVQDYHGLGQTGEIIVGDEHNRSLPIFFPLRPAKRSSRTEAEKLKLIHAALDRASGREEPAYLEESKASGSPWLIAYRGVNGAPWGLVVTMNRKELFGRVNRLLLVLGLTLAGLIAAITVGMAYLLRPLSGRLLLQTDELESQIYEKTAALNTELAERKRAERESRDAAALYHSLVDTLPINILRKDLDGRITYANRGYCEMMGMTFEQLEGKTDWDLFPRELAEKYVADDRRTVQSLDVFEDIEDHVRPNGEKLYVHVLKAPVFNAQHEVVGTQVIFWDVTARKVAEETLKKTATDLARSNRELELFAYVASHDLQEPLRMITSYSQLLEKRYKERLDDDARTFIGYAVDGALRMQKLINDLLSYSRVGTRGKPFEATDCEKILAGTRANLKLAIEESGARISHDPLPTVWADGVQLTQLFQNLLSNALKFRGTTPPEIHVSAERGKDAPPAEWVFRVRDNGIGIDPQYFERIFVIFQRLHTTQEYPGTGIGLAICKKIVERHSGRIWVESTPGQGATFCFTIPVEPADLGGHGELERG